LPELNPSQRSTPPTVRRGEGVRGETFVANTLHLFIQVSPLLPRRKRGPGALPRAFAFRAPGGGSTAMRPPHAPALPPPWAVVFARGIRGAPGPPEEVVRPQEHRPAGHRVHGTQWPRMSWSAGPQRRFSAWVLVWAHCVGRPFQPLPGPQPTRRSAATRTRSRPATPAPGGSGAGNLGLGFHLPPPRNGNSQGSRERCLPSCSQYRSQRRCFFPRSRPLGVGKPMAVDRSCGGIGGGNAVRAPGTG